MPLPAPIAAAHDRLRVPRREAEGLARRHVRLTTGFALVAALVAGPMLCARPAQADDVPPPPEDCPSGSRGDSDHYGTLCGPWPCRTDDNCTGGRYAPTGRACRATAFCVESVAYRSHRGQGGTYERFHGSCESDGRCAEGECRAGRYCVDPAEPLAPAPPAATEETSGGEHAPASSDDEGGDCATAPRAPSGANPWWMLLPALLWLRRSDGRRRPRAGSGMVGRRQSA